MLHNDEYAALGKYIVSYKKAARVRDRILPRSGLAMDYSSLDSEMKLSSNSVHSTNSEVPSPESRCYHLENVVETIQMI